MNGPPVQGRKIEVLFLTTSYPLRPGAPEGVFVRHLAEALAPHARVRVLAPHVRGAPRRQGRNGVVVRAFRYAPEGLETLAQGGGGIPEALRSRPWRWGLVPPFLLSFGWQAARMARRADIVHAHWVVCGWLGVLGAPYHGRPVVTTLRGSDELLARRRGAPGAVYRMAVSRSARVTAVNRAFVQGRDPARYRFIPNGVRVPDRSPAPPGSRERYRFLFVGAVIGRKRVADLLEAFSRAGLAGRAELEIVGDGPEQPGLHRLAARLNLDGAVRFVGQLDHDRALARIASADCVVLPSAMEGRPNVVLEAMAAGRPVLASRVPGTAELVRDGETGFTFEVGDVDGLSGLLQRLCADRILSANLGGRACQAVEDQDLTWSACARQYLALYREVLGWPDQPTGEGR